MTNYVQVSHKLDQHHNDYITTMTRSPGVAEGPRDAGVPVEMSMSIADLEAIAHNREAPNVLCTLIEREKKIFQVTMKTVNETRQISKVVW